MQPTLCARCHKNMAVVFINRIENGQSHQEGLCLKCARELHIKPIDDIISKMGINDEDLDGLSSEMMEAMQNLSGNGDDLMNIENDDDSSDDDGKTATFPFLNRLFGAQNAANAENRDNAARRTTPVSSASRASARRRSPKVSRSASPPATCRQSCATSRYFCSISPLSSRERSSAASLSRA